MYPEINDALIASLERRFPDVLQSGCEGGDPIFLVSSFMDPAVYSLVNTDELELIVQPAIKAMVKKIFFIFLSLQFYLAFK